MLRSVIIRAKRPREDTGSDIRPVAMPTYLVLYVQRAISFSFGFENWNDVSISAPSYPVSSTSVDTSCLPGIIAPLSKDKEQRYSRVRRRPAGDVQITLRRCRCFSRYDPSDILISVMQKSTAVGCRVTPVVTKSSSQINASAPYRARATRNILSVSYYWVSSKGRGSPARSLVHFAVSTAPVRSHKDRFSGLACLGQPSRSYRG